MPRDDIILVIEDDDGKLHYLPVTRPPRYETIPDGWLEQVVEKKRDLQKTQPSHIHTLPWAHVKNDCSICLEPMKRSKELPCGHTFHLRCLMRAFLNNPTCPMCRASYKTPQSLIKACSVRR